MMKLLNRIRKWLGRDPQPPELGRTLPPPVRVNMADSEEHTGEYVRVKDWSTFNPALPHWEIPPVAHQSQWIESLVAAHAEAGSLDGLVPDLLDLAIHHRIQELTAEVRRAHQEALRTEAYLHRQAKAAQLRVSGQLALLRKDLARAEEGHARAHQALTGEEPSNSLAPVTVTPAVIPTLTADTAPAVPGPEQLTEPGWRPTTSVDLVSHHKENSHEHID